MRYCVYGLGAVGGFIAARLARSGADVCGVARGATLQAIHERGIEVRDECDVARATLPVAERLADLDGVDCVILAVKATALPALLNDLRNGLAGDAVVLTAMNGVPWWFTDGFTGPLNGVALDSVDPSGVLAAAVPAHRVIGSAVHLTCSTPEPGVVAVGSGTKLVIGPATSAAPLDEATRTAAEDLVVAGFDVDVTDAIHQEVWFKLWGNLSFNPVSMLTRADAQQILSDALLHDFVARCVGEAKTIGSALGFTTTSSTEERLQIARDLGPFRPSMLQDAEAGKQVELDALLGSVQEIGTLLGVGTPAIDTLLGLSRVHARAHGLYPA
ncbi:ketopantoate reductase family protein [Leekyejoonella antrihumi]|uniref:2-dehydropantoate 2-reductase n=1 Tax=Leekyejoonella antrihumi TaxID=1660198 RepID=A0A563E861_9MICO|nr:2-dehydropantoate 2-reductase [Leekyejoonella antrihumi]TWP38499.1 2-dehydropantoate 2-reductase [Leekyejoonella antrihumi]